MDIWQKPKSPLGYHSNDNEIDSYGVNHSGFSTGDEVHYQVARIRRENELIEQLKKQGVTNLPQYGTNFWGNPENNYGFGTSHIEENIEKRKQAAAQNNNLLPSYNGRGRSYNIQQNPYRLNHVEDEINYSLYGEGFSKEFIDEMVNNKEYQRALQEYAIPNEGGYVNHPNDPGGETNMGIAKKYHSNEDIRNLTRERANALLYKEVWNWNGINTLPPEVKGFVFDHGIRTSPQNAIKTTHRALEIPSDGTIIGPTTRSRLNNIGNEEFLRRYQNLVKEQDRNRKNYRNFGKGWDNRTNGYHVSY